MIIIYQFGKVGSSTIKSSLDKFGVKSKHIHRLSFTKYEVKPNLINLLRKIPIRFLIFWETRIRNKKIKIITGYRDPLPRNISAFFQSLNYFVPDKNNHHPKGLIQAFENESNLMKTPVDWFNDEFLKFCNIDITKYVFDKKKGFTIISNKYFDVFIYRLDKLSNLELEINKFIGLNSFKLINANIAEKKWYNRLYNDFKKEYKPNEKTLNDVYSNEVIKWFYSSEEIEKLKSKWLN